LVGAEYGSTFTSTPSGILFNVDDVGDASTPSYYSKDGSDVGTSGIVQLGDEIRLFVGSIGSGSEEAVFTVPDFFYEPPTVVSPLPALSQHTQAFGMEYYQTVGTKYYYKSDSHSGIATSITYDYETKTWNDEGSQVPYHLNTTSTFASTTSLVNPAEVHGFGSQQNHNGTRYFSVSNPYYEAPTPPTLANFIAMGNHQGELEYPSYTYQHKSTTNSSYVYELTDGTGTATNIHDIEYNWSDKKWKDVDTHSIHNSFGLSASDTTTMAKTSPENPSVVYIFKSGLGYAPYLHGQLWAQFNNPYYEA